MRRLRAVVVALLEGALRVGSVASASETDPRFTRIRTVRQVVCRGRLVALAVAVAVAVAVVVAGCHFGPPFMTVKDAGLDGISYIPYGRATIAGADVRKIGRAEGDISNVVSDRTVFAIAGVDPASFVAMSIDSTLWAESIQELQEAEPDWVPAATAPTHQVYAALSDTGPDEPAEALCGYFDPRAEATPVECQEPMTVTVGGRTYTAVGDGESMKAFPFSGLHVADLEAVAPMTDIDPRLYFGPDVDSTAYAIGSVGADRAVAVVVGRGLEASYFVFVAGGDDMPAELCGFVDHDVAQLFGCATAGNGDDAVMATVRDQEEIWHSHEVVEYTFTIEITCGCPSEDAGAFTIGVVDSDLVGSVAIGSTQIEPDDERAAWVPLRMNDAFQQVSRYAGSDRLEVDYDPEFGYPLRMFADPAPDQEGDEYGFAITNFKVVR